jgi:hypothetical protein
MIEPDIAKKCWFALGGVALAVGLSVGISSRISVSVDGWRPVSDSVAAESSPVGAVPVRADQPGSLPLAFRPVSESGAAAAPALAPPAQRDDWERRAFQLQMENAQLRTRLDDMLGWILSNVRGTYPLPEHQMDNLRVAPLDDDLAVSADLAELLRLEADEIQSLETVFFDSRSALLEIGAQNLQVESPDANQVQLNIPPYVEQGGLVREDLYAELEQTLGAARFMRFLQVAESGLDERFDYFGNVDRTLLFEALADDGSGIEQLYVRDERAIPHPDDPLRYDFVATERIVTDLPAEYMPYWDWLPPTIARFYRSQ